jgi:hypothetical protein
MTGLGRELMSDIDFSFEHAPHITLAKPLIGVIPKAGKITLLSTTKLLCLTITAALSGSFRRI